MPKARTAWASEEDSPKAEANALRSGTEEYAPTAAEITVSTARASEKDTPTAEVNALRGGTVVHVPTAAEITESKAPPTLRPQTIITHGRDRAALRDGLLGTPVGPRPHIFHEVGAGAKDTPEDKASVLCGDAEEYVPAAEANMLHDDFDDTNKAFDGASGNSNAVGTNSSHRGASGNSHAVGTACRVHSQYILGGSWVYSAYTCPMRCLTFTRGR